MSSIAIIAPDRNRVVGLSLNGPLPELQRAKPGDPRVQRDPSVQTAGDWPFRFDRVIVCYGNRWRTYKPDDLPEIFW